MASNDQSAQDGGAARSVPTIHFGEDSRKYIMEAIDNCVWRKAINVDDKTYWATKTPGEIGEPIEGAYSLQGAASWRLSFVGAYGWRWCE